MLKAYQKNCVKTGINCFVYFLISAFFNGQQKKDIFFIKNNERYINFSQKKCVTSL